MRYKQNRGGEDNAADSGESDGAGKDPYVEERGNWLADSGFFEKILQSY